ncbi:MAG: DUF4954 family protein [Candidatus Auribacter fodinae]|jgi:hypothetical protein|uniref:DUF4954 family protein n=1 Tax=Candidatus Auribacter fodinae TaxID=2093366 RepID=A0A3A4RA82_9BACT|nr:MAG: DUF4954 family protein [Candidatus Auribacter fodinae]
MEAVMAEIKINVIQELEKAIAGSPIIKAVQAASTAPKGRKLTNGEIDQLKAQGNFSCNWGLISVADKFTADNIWGCYFHGPNYIGCQTGDAEVDGKYVWYGLASSNFCGTEIMDNVSIIECRSISGYRINSGANLNNVGELAMEGESAFGVGQELPIAIETGGREVYTYPEITVDVAAKVASSRHDKDLLGKYASLVDSYKKKVTSARGVVEKNAVIKNCPRIINAYIGEGAKVNNALLVKNSTIYSACGEATDVSDGAYVVKSIVQWGCEVTSMAIVANSVLVEHSHVERHGKVTDSLIGPNTGIAEGEVTACLVGPFVGFHHQSLLIAAYWPEGKGNIGYGANVGSNHTSKAPDQELWAGEGLFYGLSVNIKFPSNYSRAPYSIIATGVSALPQRFEFPFSLMNTPGAVTTGISPAYNEVMPGWVLSDNIFTVKRNEGKYMKRNKAKRSELVFEVFRPEIIDLMIDARKRLQVSQIKDVYTSKEIKGLGKNYMYESSRNAGIEAYTFYLKYYGLKGLYTQVKQLVAANKKDALKTILSAKSSDARWEHERTVLLQELPGKSLSEYLSLLGEMENQIAASVRISKEKDDKRGAEIIPDYNDSHELAKDNSFVKQTQKEADELNAELQKLIKSVDTVAVNA